MYKFGLKKYISSLDISVEKFIPIFHNWIQEDRLPQHLLIDVADYKHLTDGPQIILISHEGHLVIDFENNQPGLQYIRKSPLGKNIDDAIKGIKEYLDYSIELIKVDSFLRDKVEFTEEYELISNSRYTFPNNENSGLELIKIARKVFNDHILTIREPYNDSRLTINIQ